MADRNNFLNEISRDIHFRYRCKKLTGPIVIISALIYILSRVYIKIKSSINKTKTKSLLILLMSRWFQSNFMIQSTVDKQAENSNTNGDAFIVCLHKHYKKNDVRNSMRCKNNWINFPKDFHMGIKHTYIHTSSWMKAMNWY